MRTFFCAFLGFLVLSASPAGAESADALYIPPAQGRKAVQSAADAATLQQWLARPYRVWDFAPPFVPDAKALLEQKALPLQVAVHYSLPVTGKDIFRDVSKDGAQYRWVTAVRSQGALAVRAQVALESISDDIRLFLIDAVHRFAFGPYTASNLSLTDGWLPTLQGDTLTLVVFRESSAAPEVTFQNLAHFFINPLAPEDSEKALPCPLSVACVSDPQIVDNASGVTRLLLPTSSGQFLCSGGLINAPDTPELEPLILTAHHCVDNGTNFAGVEALWDYRRSACDTPIGDPAPTLPRNVGSDLLADDDCHDGALLRLKTPVPVGDFGRTYLGWTTDAPIVGENVVCIHHPAGTDMKVSIGHILEVDVTQNGFQNLIHLQWDEGITEGGSSGSPLFSADKGYRIIGMLSNGNVHQCGNPPQNLDNYASFRDFFPRIACHLTTSLGCEDGRNCGRRGLCPFKYLYGERGPAIDALRSFRDRVLGATAWGRSVTHWYYAHGRTWVQAMEREAGLRGVVAMAALPPMLIGAVAEQAETTPSAYIAP